MSVRYVEELGRSVLLRDGTSDEAVFRDTFQGRHHLPPHWMGYQPMTVLDLGCNIGLTVAHYAHLWPSARIVGVELNRDNARVARVNTQRLAGVEILQMGVAGERGVRRYRRDGVEEWAYRLEPTEEGVLVHCDTIAGFLTTTLRGLEEQVDLVKMDIEGGEAEVLNSPGGWPLMIRHLLVEIHKPYTVEEAIADLERRGFEARPHEGHPSAVWAWRP